MDVWGPDRAGDLAALCATAMTDEALSVDELTACCWDDPGLVLATDDGSGTIVAVTRQWGDAVVAFIKLLVVHPNAQRTGIGRALLSAAEDWAWKSGASEMHLGGSAPFYLWPGVDMDALAMLCLAESAGYEPTGAAINMSVPVTFRAPVPAGVEVRRVLDDDQVAGVEALVGPNWPSWLDETRRAIEQGTCLATFDASGTVTAFACHSVNRARWFGPTGTAPDRRHEGAGLALLGEVAKDLMAAGYRDIEICWIGPIGFYVAAGGSVSRVYRTLRRHKDA
ncbi:MAG: GNAT family N-acetyltransferase [Actinomycetes bacterium]